MATEVQKIMQVYKEGVAFGISEGASRMRIKIICLLETSSLPYSIVVEEFFNEIEKINVNTDLTVST